MVDDLRFIPLLVMPSCRIGSPVNVCPLLLHPESLIIAILAISGALTLTPQVVSSFRYNLPSQFARVTLPFSSAHKT